MKKLVKIFLLTVLALLTSALLCSCNVIDELKEQRVNIVGEMGEFQGVEQLEYKGVVYKKLINNGNKTVTLDNEKTCYVVDREIPLLFIQDYGYSARYDREKDVINYRGYYYCPPDKYEAYSEALNSGVTEFFRSVEYVVDEEKKQVFTQYYVVSEDATLAINDCIFNKVGRKYEESEIYEWKFVELDACDRDNLVIDVNYRVTLYHNTVNDSYGVLIKPGDGTQLVKEIDEKWWGEIAVIFQKADFDLAHAKAYGYELDLDKAPAAEAY